MRNNDQQDFSFCILWSPLHPVTALLPFIGHLGIADSHGNISDFQGSFYVHTNEGANYMAFGPVTRYLKLQAGNDLVDTENWDNAVEEANEIYCQREHNICCDNCHSHVANALNRIPLQKYGVVRFYSLTCFESLCIVSCCLQFSTLSSSAVFLRLRHPRKSGIW